MNRKLLMASLTFAMIFSVLQVATLYGQAATDLSIDVDIVDGNLPITLDGKEADWSDANIPEYDVTLTKFSGSATLSSLVRLTYNSTHMAMAFIITDGKEYNLSGHHFSPAVGIEWQIDEAAGPHMGQVESDSTSGAMVDIWHWEMEEEFGVLHTPNDTTGHGGMGLDDEWAKATDDRHDDDKESSLWGAYGYIDDESEWIFEFIRPLTTGDSQDATFVDGESSKLALAYWDPTESTENGWSDSGHYISVTEYEWITINWGGSGGFLPGFTFFAAFAALVAIPMILKRRK